MPLLFGKRLEKMRLSRIMVIAALAGSMSAQTRVDLRSQSKSVDFSGASSTKPFRVGTTLPPLCQVGEFFYKTNSPAGQNVYGCTATNIWTLEGGSGGSSGGISSVAQLTDFIVTPQSGTVLSIGANCSSATPCNVRVGSTIYTFQAGATASISAGTGTAYIYVDRNGVLTVGHNISVTCSQPCIAASGITSFPADVVPLYAWTSGSGQWNPNGGVDQRAVFTSKPVVAGPGIQSSDNGVELTLQVDPALVPVYVRGSASLTFSGIPSGTCSSQTIVISGASGGAPVVSGWPTLPSGIVGTMWVSQPDTITVRLCNISSAQITPGSAPYTAAVSL
jgi:hypothetical protein